MKQNDFLLILKAKSTFCIFIALLISPIMNGQNLVPNGGFEEYYNLPNDYSQWSLCKNWNNVNGINDPLLGAQGSPDYFHRLGDGPAKSPNTYQANVSAHSGDAIMGIICVTPGVTTREYMSVQLLQPLIKGKIYQFSFWITNGNGNYLSGMSSNHFGVCLSTQQLKQQKNEAVVGNPQFEIMNELWAPTWVNFTFRFKADSAYQYLTLGNFKNDAATSTIKNYSNGFNQSYYFIDDVELIPLSILITGDSDICLGESSKLETQGDNNIFWVDSKNPTDTLFEGNSFTVSPNSTTQYIALDALNTDTFTVTVHELPTDILPADTTLCQGEKLSLQVNEPNYTVSWLNSPLEDEITVDASGTYTVLVKNEHCQATFETQVTVLDTLVAQIVHLTNKNYYCFQDETAILKILLPDTSNYTSNWKHNFSRNEEIEVNAPGVYTAEINNGQCISTISTNVVEYCSPTFYLPNSFTPNNDGLNDYFPPFQTGVYEHFNLEIFNRWGELIYFSKDIYSGWDGKVAGKNAQMDVYVFKLSFSYVNENGILKTENKQGTVTLFR